jgi:hypothetical protein
MPLTIKKKIRCGLYQQKKQALLYSPKDGA